MTGSDRDTPTERGVPETPREAAPVARPSPAAGFGQRAQPSPGVAPRSAVVFGRRAQPPAAPPPAEPGRSDPPPLSTTAANVDPPLVAPLMAPAEPARTEPPALSTAAPNVNQPPPAATPPPQPGPAVLPPQPGPAAPPPQPGSAVSPQPGPAAMPGGQTDASKLNDPAFLAAEAIRLGIRVGDDPDSAALDGDAKLIAEARRMGLKTDGASAKDWTVPFDEEMERTAILLGIRSEESFGKPVKPPGGASKALPWVVMLVLTMVGAAGVALFMDQIIAFFRS